MSDIENIHAGHRDRMRERFLRKGLDDFHDHEALEMLLYYVIRRGNTNETAHMLLHEFGTLNNVLNASIPDLCRVKGVGESMAVYLQIVGAFFKRCQSEQVNDLPLANFENRLLYFRTKLYDKTDENILLACLDDRFRVIRCENLAKGTAGSVHIETNTLLRFVTSVPCSRVILAHNHPCGEAEPSYEDIMETKTLGKLLRSISVTLVDHIIVAGNHAMSMYKTGAYDPEML